MTAHSPLRLTFAGGAREVTGSCILVEAAGRRFLVDCGMFQGRDAATLNRTPFVFEPASIEFVLLTHAHVDHCGLLPRLWAEGFRGRIFTTHATADFSAVMLADSAHIQEADWLRAQRRHRHRPLLPPLYTQAQVEACCELFAPQPYDQAFTPAPGLACRFRDAGHILGAAIIELQVDDAGGTQHLVFSGDLGQPGRPVVRDPTPIGEADVLVVESTYGNREHRSLLDSEAELVAAIEETLVQRHGNLVVPAFALGRTQELLFLLADLRRRGRIPRLRVFVDSPLALKATAITLKHASLLDAETRALFADEAALRQHIDVHFVESVEESKALNDITGGAVIIAASGMCDAGRIRHHLRYNLPRAEAAVLIVGFQAEGTLGRRLVDRASHVRLWGEEIPVRARVHTVGGLSAHADRQALLDWLQHFASPPARTFVVHGEEQVALGFAADITTRLHWPAVSAPMLGECVEIRR